MELTPKAAGTNECRTWLEQLGGSHLDVDHIVSRIPHFTPADIEYLFSRVRQTAFENEHDQGNDFLVGTEMFMEIIGQIKPTLSKEIVLEFEEDCEQYTRY